MKLIYVAGPIRGDVEKNCDRAIEVAVKLARAGVHMFCPHSMVKAYDKYDIPERYWIESDLTILKRFDGIQLVDGWVGSSGTYGEIKCAIKLGIHVFYPGQIEQCIEWALK